MIICNDSLEELKNMEKSKYKIIQCFMIWNTEEDCAATKPLWSLKSAEEELEDLIARE